MAEDYEQDQFENLSEGGADNIADGDSHKMRFSIDIHSIKEPSFKGLIYAKYGAIPALGIKPFITIPPIQVSKINVEEKFKNSFCSYEFTCNKGQLYSMLSDAKLEIEIWHQDRLKKDLLIGISTVEISKVLKSPEMQTPQSFVRTYDAYVPVDEVDDNKNRVKRVALLRTIVYLEDLGPIDYLRQHEKEVKLKYKDELDEIAVIPASINVRELPNSNGNDVEKANFLNELSNIEYKIIWELENWKKAEEAKFRYQLKSKEVDFLKKLNDEWKKKEGEREKIFKRSENQIQQIESKLKQKTLDLQKREQKITLLEEELKQKITETSRQIATKEEDINVVRKKQKDEKVQFEKEKAILTAKYDDAQAKLSRLQDEYMSFRKEQETSPINIIKGELSSKDLEINELRRELAKANEIKEQYRVYYDNLKNEILRLRKENESIRDMRESNQRQNNAELEQMKIKLHALSMFENKENLQSIKNEFHEFRNQGENPLQSSAKNPFTKNYLEATAAKPTGPMNSLKAARGKSAQERLNKANANQGRRTENLGEYERLVKEREDLLGLGVYGEDDPLIVEIDEQIRRLEV